MANITEVRFKHQYGVQVSAQKTSISIMMTIWKASDLSRHAKSGMAETKQPGGRLKPRLQLHAVLKVFGCGFMAHPPDFVQYISRKF